jgi:hypothetical protein
MALAPPHEITVIDQVAIQMLDVLPRLCDAVASDVRTQIPELEHVEPRALAALRTGVEQSYEEICSLLRSGLPVARTLPIGALECGIELRESGLGLVAAQSAARLSLSLARHVADSLVRSATPDDTVADGALADIDARLGEYWEQLVAALGDAYETGRAHEWQHFRAGEPARDASPAGATDALVATLLPLSSSSGGSGRAERVRARTEAILEQFCTALEAASSEPRLAAKLASADTSVVIALADEDDVCATLLLDREPIEIVAGSSGTAEAEIRIASADLKRLFAEDFHLSMAMARGRVQWSGRVRKFLRLAPVIRQILAAVDAPAEEPADDPW